MKKSIWKTMLLLWIISLILTGCGDKAKEFGEFMVSPIGKEDKDTTAEDNEEEYDEDSEDADDKDTEFAESTDDVDLDGYYWWVEEDLEYYTGEKYGFTIGQMHISGNKFEQTYFYAEGAPVRLLGGTSTGGSIVKSFGNKYNVLDNGDVEFELIGGTYASGNDIEYSEYDPPVITWYYEDGYYGLEKAEYGVIDCVTKAPFSYDEQVGEWLPLLEKLISDCAYQDWDAAAESINPNLREFLKDSTGYSEEELEEAIKEAYEEECIEISNTENWYIKHIDVRSEEDLKEVNEGNDMNVTCMLDVEVEFSSEDKDETYTHEFTIDYADGEWECIGIVL